MEPAVLKHMTEQREQMRLARDHMARAQMEVERAMERLGSRISEWFFFTDEKCECGRCPSVGMLEIYRWLAEMHRDCKKLYDDVDERLKEPLIQANKRGSRRGIQGPIQYLDSHKELISLGGISCDTDGVILGEDTETEVEVEVLPTIQKAPKEEDA